MAQKSVTPQPGQPVPAKRARSRKPRRFDAHHLVGKNGVDTVNQATAILEHLAEKLGEENTNPAYGEYLLYKTIAAALRHGVEQLLDEA